MERILLAAACNRDIIPVFAGYEKCAPSHSFGPAVRDCFLIHFCLSGRGWLTDKSGVHTVGAGEAFIIRPGEVTYYEADEGDPWEYAWIGFVGERGESFASAPSVVRLPSRLGERVKALSLDEVGSPEPYIAVLYDVIYSISDEESDAGARDRLQNIRRYIKYNYMKSLSVSELARAFGFERSYLFRIFKERYGIGPKEYIIDVRMKNAAYLLSEGYSVSQASEMVGYSDPFNFSKAFKAHYGISPSRYGK